MANPETADRSSNIQLLESERQKLAVAIVIPSICFSSESDELKLELLFFPIVRCEELQCQVEDDAA